MEKSQPFRITEIPKARRTCPVRPEGAANLLRLLPTNIDFHNFLKANGVASEVFIGEGSKHDFTFWNAMIDKYLPQLLKDE